MLAAIQSGRTRTDARQIPRFEPRTLHGPDEATRTRLDSPTAVGSSEWQTRCDNGGGGDDSDDWRAGACEAGHAMENRRADNQASHVPKEE